ncbi:MAG TPA: phenylalanine--tRNA ligase subunit alpha [Patescibacteria group bacterium]
MQKGSLHPLTQIQRIAVSALGDMGFDIVEGPEIDTAWYTFDSLRLHADHPARSDQDTFWLTDGKLLRPHTSNMQLHVAQQKNLPIRAVYFGNCYRNDATDATHEIVFRQIECLAIDETITLQNLLATLETFIKRVLGPETTYRFRPHNFPYTEPSIEVDVLHNGKWVELLGAGMVHPEVLRNMGIDSNVYSGFAFGIGIDRLALMKWGVEDIRLLRSNRLPFLRQFRSNS